MRAVVLGGVAWNTMVYLDRFPEPRPKTVFARGDHTTLGSSGAGKALNLRRLGADVTLWAAIGDDQPGEAVRKRLDAEGVRFLPTLDPAGTMRHLNLMDPAGERISIFLEAGSPDLAVDYTRVLDTVLADDPHLVAVTILEHCRGFLPRLRERGVPIWVDVHDYDGANPYHREFVEAADVLFLSSVAMPDYRAFMRRRIEAGASAVVCTHGPAGATGLSGGEWIDLPAMPVAEVVDGNGAGDAFFAGFALAWTEGRGLATAMQWGARMGAAAVQSPELAPLEAPPLA